jgi:hypothetical protein
MLFGAHSSTGAGAGCIIDWTRQRAWIYGDNSFFSNINFITGVEQNFGSIPGQCNASPMGLDANGNLYLTNGGLSNGGETQINGTTLAQLNTTTWGFNVFGGGDYANVPVHGLQYMLDTGVGGGLGVNNRINVALDTANLLNQNWTWGPHSRVCAGPVGARYGYMINGVTTNTIELFQVAVYPSPMQTLIGSYTPTSIDGTWTSIDSIGICLDATDGNPIVCFTGNGAVGTYIAKLDGVAGTVLWTVPLPSNPGITTDWKYSSILNSVLYVMTPSHFGSPPVECTTINTVSGSYSSSSANLAGVNPVYGPQISNDTLGAVALQCDYNQTGGGPVPLNATPTSFGNRWALLYVAPGISPPPPVVLLGSAYFIERMDNREWAARENVWCVDCALQTELPTFNATLYAGSATGLGVPTGVTGLFGGQGYSVGTTAAILDPTGTGAGVNLIIASGIITSVIIVGGTGYTYPQLIFTDPANSGMGASAQVTLDNSTIFKTDAAVFNAGMVGDVIRMGGGVATITAYTNAQQVTANITTPIVDVLVNSGGTPVPQPSGSWSIATPITQVFGLMHLAGFTVTGVADGAVVTPRVVASDGSVTLDAPATLITLGLPFTPQVQSLYLDGGSPTVQGQFKKVGEVVVRFDASGIEGIETGSGQPTPSANSPQVDSLPWDGMYPIKVKADQALPPYGSTTQPLFTGDVRQPVKGGYTTPGQVAIQQTLPLPMNITAIIPVSLEGNQPSQTYAPKTEREPPGKPKRGRP